MLFVQKERSAAARKARAPAPQTHTHLGARLAERLGRDEEVVAEVARRDPRRVDRRERRDAAEHERLQRLGAGRAAVEERDARGLEALLAVGAPDADLAVVALAAVLLLRRRGRHLCLLPLLG